MDTNNGKKKVFKRKIDYYKDLTFKIIFFSINLWLIYRIGSKSEIELIRQYGVQELMGSSGQRSAQAIEMVLINTWGKAGLLGFLFIFLSGVLYSMVKEILEYRRFLKKDRLYNMGLVNNLYDDYQPKSIIQILKGLFRKKQKVRKKQYTSSKKMRQRLQNDKLYNKMYKEPK